MRVWYVEPYTEDRGSITEFDTLPDMLRNSRNVYHSRAEALHAAIEMLEDDRANIGSQIALYKIYLSQLDE